MNSAEVARKLLVLEPIEQIALLVGVVGGVWLTAFAILQWLDRHQC